MGVARPANPSLRRVFVASDDSIKALYDDNSVLLLNTCGNTFTSIDQHGSRTTQLTLFALKRYHTKLAEVVSFRNLHTEATLSVPYLSPSTHSLGYTVTAVRWPTTLAEAAAEGLLQTEPDGSIALDSHDHAARVVLHVNRCRLAVCYPLLTSTCEHKHDYSWQTQLFATWECPDCWQYPLSLLQAAVQEEHHVSEQQQEQLAANSTSQLPTAFSPDTTLSGVPKHTWWQDCSDRLPTDIAIKLEWTPEALYQYSPSTGEVAVWIHADESCLISEQDGRFFRHCTGQPELERLYAAEAVPTNTTGSTRHPLGAMANHATALRCT